MSVQPAFYANDWVLIPLYAGQAQKIQVHLAANTSYRRGTILGQKTNGGAFAPYVAGNADGTGIARLILETDCATDSDGYITLASLTFGSGPLADRRYDRASAFFCGTFRTTDLVGLDELAVSQLGRLIQGVVTNGMLRLE